MSLVSIVLPGGNATQRDLSAPSDQSANAGVNACASLESTSEPGSAYSPVSDSSV
jgi:hypothetical protein